MSIIEANNIFIGELEENCIKENLSLVIEGGKVTGILQENGNVQTA